MNISPLLLLCIRCPTENPNLIFYVQMEVQTVFHWKLLPQVLTPLYQDSDLLVLPLFMLRLLLSPEVIWGVSVESGGTERLDVPGSVDRSEQVQQPKRRTGPPTVNRMERTDPKTKGYLRSSLHDSRGNGVRSRIRWGTRPKKEGTSLGSTIGIFRHWGLRFSDFKTPLGGGITPSKRRKRSEVTGKVTDSVPGDWISRYTQIFILKSPGHLNLSFLNVEVKIPKYQLKIVKEDNTFIDCVKLP